MKKLHDYFTIALFFLPVLLFAAAFVIGGAPAQLLAEHNKTASLNEHIRENVPLTQSWKELYSRTCAKLGQHEMFGVYDTGDRLVRVFSDYNDNTVGASIDAINAFNNSYPSLPAYVMIVPTASGIYRAELPAPVDAVDQQALIEELYYRINAQVTPLDVWGALYSSRDDYIYFRSDDRWTVQGAYAAYSAAIPKLGGSIFSISNYDVDHTNVEFYGGLSAASADKNIQPDMISVYRSKFGSYIKSCDVLYENGSVDERKSVYSKRGLKSSDKYSYFFGTTQYRSVNIETNSADLPRLLVIGSDYANCFVPLLAPHYSGITLLNSREFFSGNTEELADPKKFDQVLFLFDLENFCEGSAH